MHQNFKIFIKDKLILFTANMNIPIRDKNAVFYRYQGMKQLIIEFERFINVEKISRTGGSGNREGLLRKQIIVRRPYRLGKHQQHPNNQGEQF